MQVGECGHLQISCKIRAYSEYELVNKHGKRASVYECQMRHIYKILLKLLLQITGEKSVGNFITNEIFFSQLHFC